MITIFEFIHETNIFRATFISEKKAVGILGKELGEVYLYPNVAIKDSGTTRIAQGDHSALEEFIKINKKTLQKEWNRLNGKPVSDPRRSESRDD